MLDKKELNSLTEKFLKFWGQEFDLDFDTAKNIYIELIQIINYHNKLYYIDSNPIISDYEYDILFNLLKKIENSFPQIIDFQSPTQRLNNQIQENFKQEKHLQEMLSLENSYNATDLNDRNDFLVRQLNKVEINNRTFVVEPKYDGLSIELVYKKWRFFSWITRWDGIKWENVSQNIKTILDIPLFVPTFQNIKKISLRAEIVMSKKSFEKINSQRLAEWQSLFANPRNAASWSLRQLDSRITACRWLSSYVYEVLYSSDDLWLKTQIEVLNFLNKAGFSVNKNYREFDDINKVIDYCIDPEVKEIFENWDIEYDWLVVKVNEIEIHKVIWNTNHHPRWAMAYKFPTKQISTRILDVEFSVGRSWVITPVAILDPVNVWWVKISRASMHNFDYIAQKDICIWDYVWVQRSWEVIPYILWVITEKRADCIIDDFEYLFENWQIYYVYAWKTKDISNLISDCVVKILPPKKCPVCNTDTVKIDWEVNLYCGNINCLSVIREQIIHFASKDCMDIDWFGDKFAELLVENWIINNFSDIYKLDNPQIKLQILSLPLMWKKRVSELLYQIQKSKNNSLRRIINWLWIKFVWKKSAKIIEKAIYDDLVIISQWNSHTLGDVIDWFDYKCLDRYLTDEIFLNNIYGIWQKTVFSLKAFMSKPQNIYILDSMQKTWLKFNNFVDQLGSYENPLTDKKFSITWKFDLSRPEIVDILEKFGAIFDDQPTKETDFILVGEWWWSKLVKADKYKVKIINWFEWLFQEYPFVKDKIENVWILKYQEQNLFD